MPVSSSQLSNRYLLLLYPSSSDYVGVNFPTLFFFHVFSSLADASSLEAGSLYFLFLLH